MKKESIIKEIVELKRFCKEVADLSYLADKELNPNIDGLDFNTRNYRMIHDNLVEIIKAVESLP